MVSLSNLEPEMVFASFVVPVTAQGLFILPELLKKAVFCHSEGAKRPKNLSKPSASPKRFFASLRMTMKKPCLTAGLDASASQGMVY